MTNSGTKMSELEAARKVVLREGWLSQTPPDFQKEVLRHCVLKKFRRGAMICRLGDPPGGIYGLVTGTISIEIDPAGRGPYVAHIGQPGKWYGQNCAFTGEPRKAGLRATSSTTMLYLPLPAIRYIVDQDPSAWRLFALIIIGQYDNLFRVWDTLMRRDHTMRFVARLLQWADSPAATTTNAGSIELAVSQEELAAMANVARNTASAILRDLEKAGHVELSYRRIRIVSPAALYSMLASRD